MQAFIRRNLNEVISFAVMLLMVVAIVHGQFLLRSDEIVTASASGFDTVASERSIPK